MIAMKIVVGFSGAAYIAAALLYLSSRKKIGYLVHLGAWILNLAVIVVNWVHNGYVPFVSMYQVLTFLAFTFPLAYLYMHFVKKLDWTVSIFSFCSAVVLIGVLCMDATLKWTFPPALQSGFFLPHVFCYMLSYTLCAVSFVLTILMLFQRKTPQLAERTEKGVYTIALTAYPFMLAGMLLGSIWANECWGTFWAWDPKEVWSLVTFLLYGMYFHCRRIPYCKKWVSPVILILGFAALLMTFLGVGLLGADANHSYS